jgi:hypothetical protein
MNTAAEYAEMLILYGEYGAMHVRMQENMQYVFQTITYFYGW